MSRLLAPLALGSALLLALLSLPVLSLATDRAATAFAQGVTEPAVGEPVTFLRDPAAGADGGEVTITVDQVVDPFATFGATAAPPGTRLVFVSLTIANAGDSPLTVDPATFFVQDADGLLSRPIDLATSDTVDSFTVEPDASLAGGVVFAVGEDAALARLFHDPAPDRLIFLANLAGPAVVVPTPDATTPTADNGGGQTPVPSGTGEIDCANFAAYYDETKARLDRLEGFSADLETVVDSILTDPIAATSTIEGLIAELDQFAEEQRNATVPAGAESLNDRIVAMYERYSEGFRQMADGLQTLDPTAIQAAIPIVSEADDLNQQILTDIAAAAEACGVSTG